MKIFIQILAIVFVINISFGFNISRCDAKELKNDNRIQTNTTQNSKKSNINAIKTKSTDNHSKKPQLKLKRQSLPIKTYIMKGKEGELIYSKINAFIKSKDIYKIALFKCADQGDIGGFIATLKASHLSIDTKDQFGNTPLMHAVAHKKFDLSMLMLRMNANADVVNDFGSTPIFLANITKQMALFNEFKSLQMKRLISQTHTKRKYHTTIHITPLIAAAARGDNAFIEKFVRQFHGNPNAHDQNGVTPLMSAVTHKRIDTTQLLLELGANPTEQNFQGNDAIDLAINQKSKELEGLLKYHTWY